MPQKVSEADFIASWQRNLGSAAAVAREVGINERAVHARRRFLESQGHLLTGAPHASQRFAPKWAYHRLRNVELQNGTVIVYSDAHYWPGMQPTKAFKALLKLCEFLDPQIIVANGDLIDGATISKYGRTGWEMRPTMTEELKEMQERQAEIVDAAPKALRFRTVGNHDARLDTHFANNADKFEGLPGTRLSDFLPDWPESWRVNINNTVIKHRFRGGVHAAYNNVLQAGESIVTGHLHKLEAKSLRGYRDHRVWGVETGTLSDNPGDLPNEGDGPFEYTEDGPSHWASGFAVLTYHKGALVPPEFCSVEFGHAWFRGSKV